MIGLTKPQTIVNANYVKKLQEKNLPPKRVANLAAKHAARQHRYRAQMIARTELAFAFNQGMLEWARQAQAEGYLGKVVKVWRAACDKRSCSVCLKLHGTEVPLEEPFPFETRLSDPDARLAPPAHPMCRCAIDIKEIEPPTEPDFDEIEEISTLPESDRYDIIEEINTVPQSAADIQVPPFHADGFTAAKTPEEAQEYAAYKLGLDSLDTMTVYQDIPLEVANAINYAITQICTEFGDIVREEYLKDIKIWDKTVGALYNNKKIFAAYSPTRNIVYLNEAVIQDNALQLLAEDAAYQYQVGGWSTDSPYHSVYHELGHAVQHMLCDGKPDLWDKITDLLEESRITILGKNINPKTANKKLKIIYGKKAKDAGTSFYALCHEDELIAESIAQYLISIEPNLIAEKVIALLKGG